MPCEVTLATLRSGAVPSPVHVAGCAACRGTLGQPPAPASLARFATPGVLRGAVRARRRRVAALGAAGAVLLALAARTAVSPPDMTDEEGFVLLSEDLDALGVWDEPPLPGERFVEAFVDDDLPPVDTLFDDSLGDVAL